MHNRYAKVSRSHVYNLYSLLYEGQGDKQATFELVSSDKHIVSGIARLAALLQTLDVPKHLRLYTNYPAPISANDKVLDWLSARSYHTYSGTMFAFREGFHAPAGAPLIQLTGSLLENFLIGPIVLSVMTRSLAVSTAAYTLRKSLGFNKRYVCGSAPTEDFTYNTSDALAAITAGFDHCDDVDAQDLYSTPLGSKHVFDPALIKFFGSEQDAWMSFWKTTGNNQIMAVDSIQQAKRLLNFAEEREVPLGAILVDSDLKLYRKLLDSQPGHVPALWLKVFNHKAAAGLRYELNRIVDGVIYYPASDTSIKLPDLSYNMVEYENKPTEEFPKGKSFPIRQSKTNQITVHSYVDLMKDPRPLRDAPLPSVFVPIFRSGVVATNYLIPKYTTAGDRREIGNFPVNNAGRLSVRFEREDEYAERSFISNFSS